MPSNRNNRAFNLRSLSLILLILALWILPYRLFLPPSPAMASTSNELSILQAEFSGCGGQIVAPINSDYEQQVVELVNAERAKEGLPPLKRTSHLDDAARYHAADMSHDSYFKHDTYDRDNGTLVYTCAWYTRINSYYSNMNGLGENIAVGYTSPQYVMNAWMNSPGHKANILNEGFWEIGVGYYSGNYWVQDFGRRSGVYPVVINNEAAQTDSPQVTLYLYGSWAEMRLRNDDQPWTAWQSFQNTLSWRLPNIKGEHTVTVEMRSGSNNVISSDAIYLNTAASPQLGNLPERITIIYSNVDHQFFPSFIELKPLNVGSNDPVEWEVETTGDWFALSSTHGTTPEPLIVSPTEPRGHIQTAMNSQITVMAISPPGVAGSPHTISLTLLPIDTPIQKAYLPLLTRSGP